MAAALQQLETEEQQQMEARAAGIPEVKSFLEGMIETNHQSAENVGEFLDGLAQTDAAGLSQIASVTNMLETQ